MKKVFITRLIGLLALLVNLPVYAYDFESGGIYYNIDGDNVTVTSGDSKYQGDVTIPSQVAYNGKTYSVTSIGERAFIGCSSLTSMTIPNSVTTIGSEAFYECSGLTSVTIPNSVTSIDGSAFYKCSGLTSITIPNSVTSIGGSAFYGTAWYDNQPDGLVYAGKFAYRYKGNMPANTHITIKDGTLGIAGSAFYKCIGLASITIPNSVTSIGSEAFYKCTGLTSMVIPNSVTSISSGAFIGCSSLTSITIPNSVTSIGYGAFSGCTGLTSVTIPNSVTSVGYSAFSGCTGLISVTIPNSVASIGESAFYKCSGLTSVAIPNHVEIICPSTFQDCSSLTSITIPKSVSSIGYDAFRGCSSLTSVHITDLKAWCETYNGSLMLDYHLYLNGVEIKDLVIPEGVTSIHNFYNCSSLTSLTIPNSVTSISGDAFSGCSGLASIKVESGNPRYDSRNDCNAIIETSSNTLIVGCKNTIIPNSVTSIGFPAFYGCSSLTSVTIPNSVTSIGGDAFRNCSGLTSITIPNSVTNIGDYAFLGTAWYDNQPDGLVYAGKVAYTYKGEMPANTHITIKDGSLGIAGEAFYGCSGLTSVTIPNSVTSIGYSAFSGCTGLTSVTIPNSVTSIGVTAFCYCSGLTSVTIPNSVTEIGWSTFFGCTGLTSVTIPNSVTSIGGDAFRNCSGLTSITIPNSVTNIGDYAFSGTAWYDNQPDGLVYAGKVAYKYKGNMPSNTHITIKDGTLGIVGEAFLYYSGLTSVTIPNSLTSIGSSAFFGCTGLTTITSEIEKPFEINSNTFSDDTYTNVELIVPKGTKALYQATEGWNKFTRVTEAAGEEEVSEFSVDGIYYKVGENNTVFVISGDVKYSGDIVIPEQVTFNGKTYSVTSIGRSAFNGCGDLISITIPNSVTSIEWEAFDNCSGLTSIIIPNSVTSIGKYAFSGCSGITSLTISNTLSSISGNAFQLCSSLTSVIIPNSVSVINDEAFYGCTGLTTIIIPNSVAWIGEAFRESKGLTTIISGIENPFELYPWAFSEDTYKVAELIVPKGTKALYQSTKGWNKFTKITEAADKDEANFAINGVTYQGTKSSKTVVVKAVDTKQMSVEIPASVSYDGTTYQVTGIADDAFKGSNMAALVWNVDAALPNNAFSNALIGSNFLLYVKQTSFAPSSIKNVIANGTAQKIVLSDDGGQFYCPQAFTARSISYTHNYSMETDIGKAKGWETLALPFDVQKILHSTRGEIVPFPSYNSSSIQKPFWLANFSGNGFRRTAAVLANEPYIIAMPNSKNYRNDYNLAGEVTFSADNVQVPKTPSFSGTFVPAFGTVPQSSTVYALNVNNRHVKYSGNYDAGSRFIANLRDVRPFEAYISNSSTRGIIEINFDDGTTDMFDILLPTDENQEVTIHTLSGQQITRITQRDFETIWQQLPKGVYIVNGKKWIK